jgi:uncharacterized MAPEG superfamily protein
MQDSLVPYAPTVHALGAVGALLLAQIVVADVAGIRAHHPPGMPVEADPKNFLFRAVRAHANTNESIAAFVLLALFGIFVGASASALNALAWVYAIGRAGHMAFYYAGIGLARSVSFGIAMLALVGMLVVGLRG